jgi:hypothetical protein
VKVEYVTDPVAYVPRLRCPSCRRPVRQIREAGSLDDNLWVALTEPLGWALIGIAALLGVMWQTVFALTFAVLFGAPILVVVLYLRGLRRGQFLCANCGKQSSFGEVRHP